MISMSNIQDTKALILKYGLEIRPTFVLILKFI